MGAHSEAEANEMVERYMARFTANGFTQTHGIDYEETVIHEFLKFFYVLEIRVLFLLV